MKEKFSFKNLGISKKFAVTFFGFLIVPLVVLFLWININITESLTEQKCETNLAVLRQTENSILALFQDITYISLEVIGNKDLQTFLKNSDLPEKQKITLKNNIKYNLGKVTDSKNYLGSLSVFREDEILFQFGKYFTEEPETSLEEIEKLGGMMLWKPAEMNNSYLLNRDRAYEITVYRAINDHDVFQNTLAYERIGIDEDYVASLYTGIAGTETESVFIADRNGQIISSMDKTMLGKSIKTEEYFSSISSEKEGIWKDSGEKKIVTYYYLQEAGWYVVKIDSLSAFIEGGVINSVIVICMILALVFGFSFYRIQRKRIIAPIMTLSKDVSSFQEGNYEIGIYQDSCDEIGVLNNNFVNMAKYIQDLIERVYKSQLREKEAQLKYLQSQINPHFLYNTLDSMRWMAVKQQQWDLAEQIEALSSLFKHALNEGKEMTTVEKEVQHLHDYLTIQKNRFGERITETIHVEPEVKKCKVLNLILQPLVENAIVHGLENKIGEGKIEVFIGKKENILYYSIQDNGLGTDQENIRKRLKERKESHNVLALDNINQRIKCKYGEEYGIIFSSEIGMGTKVDVNMPIEYGE